MIQTINSILIVVGALIIAILLFGIPTMVLWNLLMPIIFNLPTITFWQACGIQILINLLFAPIMFNKQ